MAYTQHNSPFSRKGKAKREAKRQLKSLYKQGYSDITRTTDADGSVSYAGAGERGPEQKLDRRSRRNIRQEARGDKMTNKMNMDQKGNRTTDVKRIGMNRNSSSPLHQTVPQTNETWDFENMNQEQIAELQRLGYDVSTGDWGPSEEGDYDVNEVQPVNATLTEDQQMEGDAWTKWCQANPVECQRRRDLKNLENQRGRNNPVEPVINKIPPVEITEIEPTPIEIPPIEIPPIENVPTGVEENITIGSNERNINEKVPVVKNKEVRKPGMQKVCTNWEWVERGSGQGQSRSDAGPRPTITKSKTVMRRP